MHGVVISAYEQTPVNGQLYEDGVIALERREGVALGLKDMPIYIDAVRDLVASKVQADDTPLHAVGALDFLGVENDVLRPTCQKDLAIHFGPITPWAGQVAVSCPYQSEPFFN